MFFDTWYDLLRMAIVGTLAYAGLILCLRTSGKRTLSRMNAFDFVVTVAFGSTFASAILSSSVSVVEAFAAFALLCGLQFAVAELSIRSDRFQGLIKAQPTLLFYRGAFLESAMRKERVTKQEGLAAIRDTGTTDPAKVDAVVLETNGAFSVVSGVEHGDVASLQYVQGVAKPG